MTQIAIAGLPCTEFFIMRIVQRISTLLIVYVCIGSGYAQTDNDTNNQTGPQPRCQLKHQFRCNNGQCIDLFDLCDGPLNCADGSDETFAQCGSISCAPPAFRCAYGACIDGARRCDDFRNCADNSDEDPRLCNRERPSPLPPVRPQTTWSPSVPQTCTAPPQPQNGHWKLHPLLCPGGQECNVPEGTELGLGSYLIYSCNSGYKIRGPTDVTCSIEGKWLSIPVCTEIRCKPLNTASVEASCTYGVNDEWVSCESLVLPGTKATLVCRNSYQRETNLLSSQRDDVRCNANGQWEPEPIRCVPGYTLNAVNNYDENLLHVSAANGCLGIVREILDKKENCRVVDRKNKFGWTPLMQAIRNGNIDTVKLLLERNADVNQMTYLGMSVLGLAAAISKEMFETVYDACPDALASAANDDITPLCVAAMKNDKELFLRLLELGMPSSTANGYTRIMMKHSAVPGIATLANAEMAMDDYWNDTSDNIEVMSERNTGDKTKDCSTLKNNENGGDKLKLLLLSVPAESDKQSKISPNLTYDMFTFPETAHSEKINLTEKSYILSQDKNANERTTENVLEKRSVTGEDQSESCPAVLERLQSIRPTIIDMNNLPCSFNDTLTPEFTPEFSPVKSPHVAPDINEENVFGENTPTPPRCKTPPKGMLLNWPQMKMITVLKRFGLSQHSPIFLEQEVDFDLFLTLTDKDLIEIGIAHERDRHDLLEAIIDCRNHKMY